MTANLDHASGDWVAIIDADLQDPPEVIVPMLRVARQGYDVVYGQRRSRKGETVIKKMTAAGFYRLLAMLSDVDIPKDTGDFRVMSRRVVDAISAMRERHRFLRGMFHGSDSRAWRFFMIATSAIPASRNIAFARC